MDPIEQQGSSLIPQLVTFCNGLGIFFLENFYIVMTFKNNICKWILSPLIVVIDFIHKIVPWQT